MRNSASPRQHGPPRERQTRTIFVSGATLAGFSEGAKVRTLLRSVDVLDGWLEDNEGSLEDEVRVRRVKRWRAEALRQLGSSRL